MSRRTDTTNLTSFALFFPKAVTFDFSSSFSPQTTTSLANGTIHVTIPPSSSWRMPLHWHPSENHNVVLHEMATIALGCESVTCRSGHLHVSRASGIRHSGDHTGYSGMREEFKAGERVSWGRAYREDQDNLLVDLVANHTLWRNICSAELDMALILRLASTPWWLKVLFAVLEKVAPLRRDALLRKMLRMQLQSIFLAHDFHTYHGYVPVTWPWLLVPGGDARAPDWAERAELQSMLLISRTMMTIIYWTGRLFLGMKGEYAEYTPGPYKYPHLIML